MTKSTKMKTVVAVAVAAIFVGIFIKDYLAIGSKARARRVFIENTSSSVVEVELSGGSTHSCTLAPSASCLVEVEAEAAYTELTVECARTATTVAAVMLARCELRCLLRLCDRG